MKYLPVLCALLFSGAAESATRYVNPSHSQSADRGPGTSSAPYKTITYAMRQLVSGDHLIIASGVYREALNPKNGAQNLTIEGSSGTVIKGSDVVTGWQSVGGGVFVRRGWNVNSQQVFVNGQSLRQVGGVLGISDPGGSSNIWPGRVHGDERSLQTGDFHYDRGAKNLYIKPAGGLPSGQVEVSVRGRLGYGLRLNNVQVKNLSFMHSNTSAFYRGGALVLDGNRISINNISVTRTDATGLVLKGDHNVISNSVANYNGQVGMSVRGRHAKVLNNETSYNNTRGFNVFWEAAGAKFIGVGGTSPAGLADSTIQGHRAMYNNGSGLWLDHNTGGGNKILDSVVAYNQHYGIHFEVSSGMQIYNNLVYGNKARGIYVASSSNTLVAHNLSANNGWDGIIVHNDRKATSSYRPEWQPRNNQVTGNIIGWSGGEALRLAAEPLNNKANGNLYVDDRLSTFKRERIGTYALRATGLPEWKRVSGQDGGSWEKMMGMPSNVGIASTARQVNVDWSALRAAAADLRAPATPFGASRAPGPINYSYGGTTVVEAPAPIPPLPDDTAPATPPAPPTAAAPGGTPTSAPPTASPAAPIPAPVTPVVFSPPALAPTTAPRFTSSWVNPTPAAMTAPRVTSSWVTPAPFTSASANYGIVPVTHYSVSPAHAAATTSAPPARAATWVNPVPFQSAPANRGIVPVTPYAESWATHWMRNLFFWQTGNNAAF